jgi:hypothetical protein
MMSWTRLNYSYGDIPHFIASFPLNGDGKDSIHAIILDPSEAECKEHANEWIAREWYVTKQEALNRMMSIQEYNPSIKVIGIIPCHSFFRIDIYEWSDMRRWSLARYADIFNFDANNIVDDNALIILGIMLQIFGKAGFIRCKY